jgi:hypothetical protein
MTEILGRIVSGIVEEVFVRLCRGSGRRILQFCGVRKPDHVASFFLGLTLWILLACAIAGYAAHSHQAV